MKVICSLKHLCIGDERKCTHREEHKFKSFECLPKKCYRLLEKLPKKKYDEIIQDIQCKPVFIELVKDTIKKHDKKHKKNAMQ